MAFLGKEKGRDLQALAERLLSRCHPNPNLFQKPERLAEIHFLRNYSGFRQNIKPGRLSEIQFLRCYPGLRPSFKRLAKRQLFGNSLKSRTLYYTPISACTSGEEYSRWAARRCGNGTRLRPGRLFIATRAKTLYRASCDMVRGVFSSLFSPFSFIAHGL